MKRLIAWMLALVMIFSLTACGSSGNEPASADPASESSTAAKTETKDAEPASSVPGSAAEPTASPTTAEETAALTTEEETTEPVPETEVWNENEEFTNNYENIVLLEAERQAELAALEELRKDPVHHAENELFTVDVVKVVARWNSYDTKSRT